MTGLELDLDDTTDSHSDEADFARKLLLKAKKDFFVVRDAEAFLADEFELSNYLELDMANIMEEAIDATRDENGKFM
jgi:hypothetical protein